jgi:hypothetical protein
LANGGQKPDNAFKETNYWSEIPDSSGNEDYPDSSKVHIADTGEEYQDWQNNIVKISVL